MTIGLATLPVDWEVVEEGMLSFSLGRVLEAFGDGSERAIDAVEKYFDPAGTYAGATFLKVQPNDPFAIGAADLWAVTTLSMKVPPAAGRALLNPGPLYDTVRRGLRLLPENVELANATPPVLQEMERTYSAIRLQLPSPTGAATTNQWVLASKVMARKRPLLFPVRDSLVCTYLAEKGLGGKKGQLGWFRRDLQVFAFLAANPEVVQRLEQLRDEVAHRRPELSLGFSDLRLMDVVLWMEAVRSQQGIKEGQTE